MMGLAPAHEKTRRVAKRWRRVWEPRVALGPSRSDGYCQHAINPDRADRLPASLGLVARVQLGAPCRLPRLGVRAEDRPLSQSGFARRASPNPLTHPPHTTESA